MLGSSYRGQGAGVKLLCCSLLSPLNKTLTVQGSDGEGRGNEGGKEDWILLVWGRGVQLLMTMRTPSSQVLMT